MKNHPSIPGGSPSSPSRSPALRRDCKPSAGIARCVHTSCSSDRASHFQFLLLLQLSQLSLFRSCSKIHPRFALTGSSFLAFRPFPVGLRAMAKKKVEKAGDGASQVAKVSPLLLLFSTISQPINQLINQSITSPFVSASVLLVSFFSFWVNPNRVLCVSSRRVGKMRR